MTKANSHSDFIPKSRISSAAVQDEDDDNGQLTALCHPNESTGSFFSRVKISFSSSPLGNILGQNNSTQARSNSTPTKNRNRSNNIDIMQDTPPVLTPRCLSTVEHAFEPSRARSPTIGSSHSDASTDTSESPSYFTPSLSASCVSPVSLDSYPTLATSIPENDYTSKWSPVLTSPSGPQSNPALSPAMSQADTASTQSPKSAYSQTRSASISICDGEYASTSMDNKKGKKPAPPFPYDTLLADISGPSIPREAKIEVANTEDETGEWWGLEYTLQMSRRDSRTSDTSFSTTGEHSRSRESWAAIHQGTVPPLSENANFQDWRRWHRSLEKIELWRRKKRTIDFIEESEHLAGLYVDEVQAQRAVQIHEELLTEEEVHDAVLWIEYATERRPDPFFPPEKHNIGWVLKSHRSIGCLRDLQEVTSDEE